MGLYNTTTQSEFDEKVLKSTKVVLVDFWAEWCPPCLAMAPVLDSLSQKLDTEIDVVKVNIEDGQDNSRLAGDYGVQSIPNMLIFKDGKVVDNLIGMVLQAVLENSLEAHYSNQ